MLKSLLKNVVKTTADKFCLDPIYRYLRNSYVSGFPRLRNSALAQSSQIWISHNIEILDYNQAEDLVYLKKDNLCLVTTPNYVRIIKEIFCWNIYFINPLFLKSAEYFVIDMGMNRGYASLYFANQPWCKGVYGFELNENTYKIAEKNVALNKSLKDKIQIFNFGLGAKDEILKTFYLPNRDGICTTSKEFLLNYAPEELDNVVETESTIRKSSLVLKEIFENVSDNIILKIDVEGAEYDIINDLLADYPSFFDKVDIIIGESHFGLEPLLKVLEPMGYKQVSGKKINPKTQDFLFVKE